MKLNLLVGKYRNVSSSQSLSARAVARSSLASRTSSSRPSLRAVAIPPVQSGSSIVSLVSGRSIGALLSLRSHRSFRTRLARLARRTILAGLSHRASWPRQTPVSPGAGPSNGLAPIRALLSHGSGEALLAQGARGSDESGRAGHAISSVRTSVAIGSLHAALARVAVGAAGSGRAGRAVEAAAHLSCFELKVVRVDAVVAVDAVLAVGAG